MTTKKEKCCDECKDVVGEPEWVCVKKNCPCHQSESIEWKTLAVEKGFSNEDIDDIESVVSLAITTAVAKRDAQLVEEVEKMQSNWGSCCCTNGECFNPLDKVLSILKH